MLEKYKMKKPSKEMWIIVIAVGMLLMVITIPVKKEENVKDEKKETEIYVDSDVLDADKYAEYMETRIKQILNTVEGVGQADVLVALKSSQEMIVWSDNSTSQAKTLETDSSGGSRLSESIDKSGKAVYSNSTGEGGPFIQKKIYPEISGIIITADGGDSVKTVSEISEAIEALLGLPPHKIKVLKRG